MHYLDYTIIATINDILVNNKQSLNGSKNSIEQILHKINIKLYENFINMQNGQENILCGNPYKTQKEQSGTQNPSNYAGENASRRGFNNQNIENQREKDKFNNNKENSNYLKINKLNILKELFNTFEIFNKSDYEIANSKNNANKSDENDGWIFQREIKKQTLYKENQLMKNSDKEIINIYNINIPNNESKSELNLNRFNRFNSNLNSVGVRNEREKFEFSDKHNVAKKSIINAVYNSNYGREQLAAGGSNSHRQLDLNKKASNGSQGYCNDINNDTIVDMKNRRIGNEMNTITLSRIDHNETIKDANNNSKFFAN